MTKYFSYSLKLLKVVFVIWLYLLWQCTWSDNVINVMGLTMNGLSNDDILFLSSCSRVESTIRISALFGNPLIYPCRAVSLLKPPTVPHAHHKTTSFLLKIKLKTKNQIPSDMNYSNSLVTILSSESPILIFFWLISEQKCTIYSFMVCT